MQNDNTLSQQGCELWVGGASIRRPAPGGCNKQAQQQARMHITSLNIRSKLVLKLTAMVCFPSSCFTNSNGPAIFKSDIDINCFIHMSTTGCGSSFFKNASASRCTNMQKTQTMKHMQFASREHMYKPATMRTPSPQKTGGKQP